MRFATSRRDRPELRALVAGLDADDLPVAETWRRVAEVAAEIGLPRPSYPHTRRLVADERRRRRARAELQDVLRDAASTFAAGRVPSYDHTLGRLLDAQAALAAEEACVSETQGFFGRGDDPD